MRPVVWSLMTTGVAAGLLAACGGRASDSELRVLGAVGGVALALAGVALGICRCRPSRHAGADASRQSLLPRFFFERRQAPRHQARHSVRFAVNGQTYPATLVSVGASGALLRLPTNPGRPLHAEVGQPVRIEEYPAGTLARIGHSGVYVDFAVQFGTAPSDAGLEHSLPETAEGSVLGV